MLLLASGCHGAELPADMGSHPRRDVVFAVLFVEVLDQEVFSSVARHKWKTSLPVSC